MRPCISIRNPNKSSQDAIALYLTVALAITNQIGLKGSKVVVALYAIHFGASPFAIGVLASMYAVVPLLLAVYAGRTADRIGVRIPMILGSIGFSAAILIPAVFPVLSSLYAAAFFLGAANIFFHVATHSLTGSIGGPAARTRNFATFSLGGSLSGFVGPVMVGILIDQSGYNAAIYALALVGIIPAPVLMFYKKFIPKQSRRKKEVASGSIKDLLANGALRNTLFASGLIITGLDLFNFYMPIYGREIGLTASTIGVVLGMQAIAAFVVRMCMPWLAKHRGEEQVLTWSLLMAGVTYFLFPVFEQPVALASISFLLGLALGCGQPLSIILTYNYSPPSRSGEALGLRLTVNKLTQIAVPLVFGSMGTAFGVYPIFWSNAVLLLTGGLLNARNEKKLIKQNIKDAKAAAEQAEAEAEAEAADEALVSK